MPLPPPSQHAAGGGAPEALSEADSIFLEAKRYEQRLSRLLIAFVSSGLVFLIGPGSFLGVWNLFAISHQETAVAVPMSWLQAHGHAEVYGWVGSFILGIGFHSLTRIRKTRIHIGWAWCCWALWTLGVVVAWWARVYQFHWRVALPLGAALELAGFAIFQITVIRAHSHRKDKPRSETGPGAGAAKPKPSEGLPGWILLVFTGAMGLLLTLILNLAGTIFIATRLSAPTLPMGLDWQMTDLLVWSFLTPFVLGFSTRWFPIFAGLKPAEKWMPRLVPPLVVLGVLFTLLRVVRVSSLCWLGVAVVAVAGLHIFEKAIQPAKTQGVHRSFPIFFRFAYSWLLVSAILGVWASVAPPSSMIGISGASRHALTVGFVAGMILTIGPRILPAFSGMKKLYSPMLMFATLLLLETGCVLRVSGELLAYSNWLPLAWKWLPFSAGLEITAFTCFAYNIARTLMRPPAHVERWRREAAEAASAPPVASAGKLS